MRLPRLPVSRRRLDELAELVCAYNRIASEDLAEYKRRARKAEARVAELEQAIREHANQTLNAHGSAAGLVQVMMTRDRRLHSVLDGHDRQERGDAAPAGHVAQHPVRRESCCYVCGSPAWLTGKLIYLGGEDHWRHAEYQPPKAADAQDRQERGSDRGSLSDLTREEYDRLRQAAGEADGDH